MISLSNPQKYRAGMKAVSEGRIFRRSKLKISRNWSTNSLSSITSEASCASAASALSPSSPQFVVSPPLSLSKALSCQNQIVFCSKPQLNLSLDAYAMDAQFAASSSGGDIDSPCD
jgi:hypothetical protein